MSWTSMLLLLPMRLQNKHVSFHITYWICSWRSNASMRSIWLQSNMKKTSLQPNICFANFFKGGQKRFLLRFKDKFIGYLIILNNYWIITPEDWGHKRNRFLLHLHIPRQDSHFDGPFTPKGNRDFPVIKQYIRS